MREEPETGARDIGALPPGWRARPDKNTGQVYFYNARTREAVSRREQIPVPLPPHWEVVTDKDGETYYWNVFSRETLHERPTAESVAEVPATVKLLSKSGLGRAILSILHQHELSNCFDAVGSPAAKALEAELEDGEALLGGVVAAFVETCCFACEEAVRGQEALQEMALQEMAGRILAFEGNLLEMCYVHGRAAEVAAQAEAAGQSADVVLLNLLQRTFQPKIEPALRKLHAAARITQGERLGATCSSLLLLNPATIGLRQELVSSEEEPCYTVLGASWIYAEAINELQTLPKAPTVAAKVKVLIRATERLVSATASRCRHELSADDLVPLVTLALVACRLGTLAIDFELFLLDELLSEALAEGQEGYCVCTVQVAASFLRQLRLPSR